MTVSPGNHNSLSLVLARHVKLGDPKRQTNLYMKIIAFYIKNIILYHINLNELPYLNKLKTSAKCNDCRRPEDGTTDNCIIIAGIGSLP